jgi:hypothetical protein
MDGDTMTARSLLPSCLLLFALPVQTGLCQPTQSSFPLSRLSHNFHCQHSCEQNERAGGSI